MIREKEFSFTAASVKPTYIRLQLPAGEALSAAPLSAVLGQAQINSAEFCRVFNEFSLKKYEQGTLLNLDLYRNPDNSYYFIVRGISFPYLLFQVSDLNRAIPVEVLYDIFRIKLFSINHVSLDFNSSKLLFGSMRSINFSLLL